MGYNSDIKKVAWAIRDDKGIVYLKTIRNKKPDCRKDFIEYLKTSNSGYTWRTLLKNNWEIVKIKIEVV